jgi:hypothetical protein
MGFLGPLNPKVVKQGHPPLGAKSFLEMSLYRLGQLRSASSGPALSPALAYFTHLDQPSPLSPAQQKRYHESVEMDRATIVDSGNILDSTGK